MNTVHFFGHEVTKLIVGDNPFNGYSYIEDRISGDEMQSYCTAERIKEALFHIEGTGYNTVIPLADSYMIRVLREYRRDGGRLQIIFQPYMAMDQDASIRQMETVEPIAIYHQGTRTDDLFEAGRCAEIRAMMDKYRCMGIPVGLGTHRPDVIETSEREGWQTDFYMACLQNARLSRSDRSASYMPGAVKQGLLFYPEDRSVMLECLKQVDKPVIAYKLFAGGQMFPADDEPEKRRMIKAVYDEVFTALKPDDFAAIGVFQRDLDQIRENAELYGQWYNEKN